MRQTTATHIGEIVGLGLGANYLSQAHHGHPRHPDMEGGLTPRLAHTGDLKHDAAMESGRLAINIAAGWILAHVWFAYAGITAIAIIVGAHNIFGVVWNPLASDPAYVGATPHLALYIGIFIWLVLQFFFVRFWSRIFDGRRVKRSRRTKAVALPPAQPVHRPGMVATFYNNWSEPIPVAWDRNRQLWIDAWGRVFSIHNRAQ